MRLILHFLRERFPDKHGAERERQGVLGRFHTQFPTLRRDRRLVESEVELPAQLAVLEAHAGQYGSD